MFYVGQKIVCVDDNWVSDPVSEISCPTVPVLNQIYTIKDFEHPDNGDPDDLGIRLFEIESVGSFYHWHFRPVQTRDTSHRIEELKRLCNIQPTKEPV